MRIPIFIDLFGRLLMLLTALVVRPGRAEKRYDHHIMGTSMVWQEPYCPRDVIHSRFQITPEGRVILVSPRFRPGVPFTLGSFQVSAATRSIVEPDVFPLPLVPELHRINMQLPQDNSKLPPLINIVDVYLDATSDLLWLLDVGSVDTMMGTPRRIAPAKVVRLEIDEDDTQTYKTFNINTDSTRKEDAINSCLQYLVTFRTRNVEGGYYVFISDADRSSVVVLNTATGAQWYIDLPEQAMTTEAPRDIMFLVKLQTTNGHSKLYTTFMSGCRVFSVDLENLDQCIATAARPPVVEVGCKPYRIIVLGSDTGSRMFFRRPTENEIWSWDVNGPFHAIGFELVSKGRDCRAPVQVAPGYDGFIFVLKNNFANYIRNNTGSMGVYTLIQPVSILPSTCNKKNTTLNLKPATVENCQCPTTTTTSTKP